MLRLALVTLFSVITLSHAAWAENAGAGFDRVIDTGVIRCGYNQYPPYFMKDANDGSFSGIFYEITEALAKNASLKVEWTEEVGYDGIFTGLSSGRFDVLCSGIWPSTARSRVGSFTLPVFYSTISAWAPPGGKKFKALTDFNTEGLRIATIDGAQEDSIARTDFPLAQRVSSPASSAFTENFLKLSSGKADVTFAEPSGAGEYLAANPGAMVRVLPDQPLRVFGNTLAVPKGDEKLKELLNQGLQELLFSGQIEAILKKYETYPGSFARVSKPYEMTK